MPHVLHTFLHAPVDIKLLWVSVFLRLAAFGASNIVLTTYLKLLQISEPQIGVFMTLTLIGDTAISYVLTWYADFIGRRRVMILGSVLMAIAGTIFAVSGAYASTAGNYYILLVAAIVGVISPSGDEVGPFKSIEESTMAHLTPLKDRPDIYALHWLISCAGSAFGTLFTGFFVQYLQGSASANGHGNGNGNGNAMAVGAELLSKVFSGDTSYNVSAENAAIAGAYSKGIKFEKQGLGFSAVDSYRAVFWLYSGLAILKVITMLFLSDKCELNHHEHVSIVNEEPEANNTAGAASAGAGESTEESPLLADANEDNNGNTQERQEPTSSSTSLSKETVHVLTRLLCIFMVDSLAYGFMPATWIIYYFKTFYQLAPSNLGTLFFIANTVNSISSLPSSYLAKNLGPIKATLAAQVPSALFLILTPLYNSVAYSSVLLVLYYATLAMDVVPRQVLLTNLINPAELTRAMGVVNIGKTFARCVGPIFTGRLAGGGYLWVAFIINGGLTMVADLLLFSFFYGVDKKVLAKQRGY